MNININQRVTPPLRTVVPQHERQPKIRPIPFNDEFVCFSRAIVRAMEEIDPCEQCSECSGKCGVKVNEINRVNELATELEVLEPQCQESSGVFSGEDDGMGQYEWNHGVVAMAEMYAEFMRMGGFTL